MRRLKRFVPFRQNKSRNYKCQRAEENGAGPQRTPESLKLRLKEENVDGDQEEDGRGRWIAAMWRINASVWSYRTFSTSGEAQDWSGDIVFLLGIHPIITLLLMSLVSGSTSDKRD